MTVDLTPELEQLIQSKIQSGLYNSPSEVVKDALRLLEQNYDTAQSIRRNSATASTRD